MLKLTSRFTVCLAALAALTGCGGSSFPDTVEVTGTVTHNGTPVDGALVSFSPQGEGHAAVGTTDAAGKFTLTSFESGDGAVPGKYAVTVSKTEGGATGEAALPAASESEEDLDAIYGAVEQQGLKTKEKGKAAEAAIKDLLPAKYKTAGSSGLTADVTEGGANDFTFALTD